MLFFRGAHKFLLGILTFGAAVAFAPNASAQDVSEFRNAPAPMNMRPGIRYTTGAVTTAGWEKGLVEGDPNLRRWNWSAMTSYTQSSYNHVAPGALLPKKQVSDAQPLRTGSIYVKPIQVSPEINARRRADQGQIVVGNRNVNTNCNGRVRIPSRPQLAAAPVAKMYNSYGVSGTLSVPPSDSSIASRNVFGRLMQ
jgi:hypothetical protein